MKRNIVCNVDESGVLFTNLPRREVLHAPMLPNQDPNLSPNGRRFQATLIQAEITLIQQPADRPQTNQKLKQIADAGKESSADGNDSIYRHATIAKKIQQFGTAICRCIPCKFAIFDFQAWG